MLQGYLIETIERYSVDLQDRRTACFVELASSQAITYYVQYSRDIARPTVR